MDRNLLLTAIDLTRACSAHQQYLDWLSLYEPVLRGSLGIAHYFGLAAEAYENAATPPRDFDEIEARELLADELMASPPLTPETTDSCGHQRDRRLLNGLSELASQYSLRAGARATSMVPAQPSTFFPRSFSHALPATREPHSQENCYAYSISSCFLDSAVCWRLGELPIWLAQQYQRLVSGTDRGCHGRRPSLARNCFRVIGPNRPR